MTLLDLLPSLRTAKTPRLDSSVWPHTLGVDESGRLTIGGVACADIADRYGSCTHVLDEADFRRRARRYRKELPGTGVVYAGKALLTTGVARWAAEERLGVGVCTGDELATALAGRADPARIIFHGEAKSYDDLRAAVDAGVGRIVVDSLLEVTTLARLARRPQNVLVRVRPGERVTATIAATVVEPMVRLVGLHCHLGPQVTEAGQYGDAVRRMVVAMADVRRTHRLVLGELNIGGGHAVPNVSGDPELAPRVLASFVDDALDAACADERFPRPRIVVEPGRGLAARAGVSLYRVRAVKTRPGGRTFVAVDGVSALHTERYTATLANRASLGPTALMTVSSAGAEMELPADVHPGDLVAVACTGAYHPCGSLVAVRDGRLTRSRS
jgi:diaminopimelate decarboxylase